MINFLTENLSLIKILYAIKLLEILIKYLIIFFGKFNDFEYSRINF
jgi:hypothetical protein